MSFVCSCGCYMGGLYLSGGFLSPVVGGRSGDVYREHERARCPVRLFATWCR